MKKMLFMCPLFWGALSALAQPARPAPTPNDTLKSVHVSSANQLVFNLYAPKATTVTVSGDFSKSYGPKNLVKAESGVWTYTTEPIRPDLYSYDFVVDGVKTIDPKNTQLKEGENGYSNLFAMPGSEMDYCAIKDVPHGTLEQVYFFSKVTGKTSRFHVYTPPGYEKMKASLPVLYLQHGGGDNDASWSTAGRANFIMDNLYAQHKAKPMVVVMPMGHPGSGFYMNPGIDEDPYYKQLFDEIMPLVSTRYRVQSDRNHTAFAGLSMGGLQALNIALFSPEKFGYVLPLSTGYFPPQQKMLEEKFAAQLRNPEINRLKLFWIAMGGESDIAYKNGVAVNALLDKYGIKYQTNSYDAGHTFITWRHNLVEFAPLLFN
ncbi:esterase [Spirosoma pollinicola]|uniref:Esterase n=1 Tax=Spirosoma pollinicola TaxID=2057025 RepID=A0A2K8YSB1_9BACT|nr:esterase [Spirosoma pollinicola]AUD00500.1 esterase [Spirosoma pollinicola]